MTYSFLIFTTLPFTGVVFYMFYTPSFVLVPTHVIPNGGRILYSFLIFTPSLWLQYIEIPKESVLIIYIQTR
jgi:hypothetical protein